VHVSREKRVTFNKRVLENEDEIAAINLGLSDFLMGIDLSKTTFVVIGVGQRMRGTQPICEQLRIPEDRNMTETSTVLPNMEESRSVVELAGIPDVLTW
jgi:hypothetical protein